ncbi:DUF11 domain-containing protein [Nonomuraea sp. FMUSA5-5]|uniref:DUF11 domain-containing protein n=1 Tax=Nonomuraea composti TaxID=2720023 RepID=A0ABX1B326_9ACTN|nr:DUF11 domain-containing protein [Nonomuraea sp. FMUSA5-5]NJP90109.1 DUF11 domain-containing protein [Nonomuraea sp. FMUSA5-5]
MGGRPGIAALIALAALSGSGWAPASATTPSIGRAMTPAPLDGRAAASAPLDGRVPAPAQAPASPPLAARSGGRVAVPSPPNPALPSQPGPGSPTRPGPDPAPPPGADPGPAVPPSPVDPSPIGPSLHLTGDLSPVVAGTESRYTLTVTNTGDQPADGVIIAALLDHNATPGRLPSGCSRTGRTITCGGPGLTVPAGRGVTYELPITTDPALRDGTTLTHRAHVTAPGTSGDESQSTAQSMTRADVELVKTAATGDGTITYTLTVTNRGPSQATDVTVQDPTGATIAARPAECPGDGPTLSCPIGLLAPNESRTLTFTVTPSTTGVVRNCATVSTGDREERTADNRSCADALVEPAPSPSKSPKKSRREEPEAPLAEALPPEPAPPTAQTGAAADRNDVPPPAHHLSPELPLTGASFWMLGLGVAVLLAIGLLVRYFSRRDDRRDDRRDEHRAETGQES